jgi:hypothetical protein
LYDIDLGSDFLVTATKVNQHSEITIAGDQLDFIARNRSGSVIDTFTISNTPCDAVDCHVHSIVCSIERGSKGKSFGVATVTVRDDCGKPVAGAEVTGTFTGDFNEQLSSTTNTTGVAVITTSTEAKKPAYTFCVDGITHSSLTYNSGDNVETCDSY